MDLFLLKGLISSIVILGQLVIEKLFIQHLKTFISPQLQKPNHAYDIEANGTKPMIVIPSNLWGLNSLIPSVIITLVISRFEQFTQTFVGQIITGENVCWASLE